MNGKYFIDTNIFVYTFDHSQPRKRKRSIELVQTGLQSGLGVISTQVIQEFLNVATRKFAVPMTPGDSKAYIRLVMNPICQVFPDLAMFEAGLDLQAATGYSFYDSLIIAAALQGECDLIYTEDLHAGQDIHGVRVVNPF